MADEVDGVFLQGEVSDKLNEGGFSEIEAL